MAEGLAEARALGLSTCATGVALGVTPAWPLEQAASTQQQAAAIDTIRAVLKLAAGRWELTAIPERGGRIASLRLDGTELLDQGIGVDQPTTEGFVDAGAWGWDEMVPTVDASEWNGIQLPDHGEAWRLPWRVDSQTDAGCVMSVDGRVLPWRLERQITLSDTVRAEYSLINRGNAGLPAYWCSHALFRYEPDMEVDVGVRLMSFAEGKSAKFFVPPRSLDRARLKWPDGKGVEFAWDTGATPYCGVWICNGDLGGYRQVAVEPATGGGDRPASDEPAPILAPGQSLRWWLAITPI